MTQTQRLLEREHDDGDVLTVDWSPDDATLSVNYDGTMASPHYHFDVVGRYHGHGGPTTVRPTEMDWSDVGTGERKTLGFRYLPVSVMSALVDCDIMVALDADARGVRR